MFSYREEVSIAPEPLPDELRDLPRELVPLRTLIELGSRLVAAVTALPAIEVNGCTSRASPSSHRHCRSTGSWASRHEERRSPISAVWGIVPESNSKPRLLALRQSESCRVRTRRTSTRSAGVLPWTPTSPCRPWRHHPVRRCGGCHRTGVDGSLMMPKTRVSSFPPIEPLPPRKGAPDVLPILLDDSCFAAISTFGEPCSTPTAERLAGQGLTFNRFHVCALCSPTPPGPGDRPQPPFGGPGGDRGDRCVGSGLHLVMTQDSRSADRDPEAERLRDRARRQVLRGGVLAGQSDGTVRRVADRRWWVRPYYGARALDEEPAWLMLVVGQSPAGDRS